VDQRPGSEVRPADCDQHRLIGEDELDRGVVVTGDGARRLGEMVAQVGVELCRLAP